MKLRTLALTAAIGLTAVAATQAQDVSGRSLILRGPNVATPANVGTLTVPVLTAPRIYTLQNQAGTVALQTPAVLGTNTFILADATGKLDNMAALTNGQIFVGSTGLAPVATLPTGTRGLVVTTGAGTLDLAMPTGVADQVLVYSAGNWVSSGATFTVGAATGNVLAAGDMTLGTGLSATGGSLVFNDNVAADAFTGTILAPVFTANRTINLPDASGTIVVSSGGTANQLTRFGAGGTSIVDASLSDDGAGTLSRTGSITVNANGAASNIAITASGTTATISQTGDALGGSSLALQNRTGSNGALFSTTGANDLVDFGFKPPTSVQSNIRLEGRPGQKRNASNADGEFQFYMNSTPGPSTFSFYAGNAAVGSLVNTNLGDDDADITTIRGAINLNTTNTAGATVNINTSAFANSTNIGNTTAGGLIQMNANRAGFAVQVVNANAAGRGLTISDAVVEGLSIGSGTAPTTGITVNAATTGIVVNTGAAADLRINEALITTAGTDLTISQTGDGVGGSSLMLLNRLKTNGALLSTTSGPGVVDLAFKPHGIVQSNFRNEGRDPTKVNALLNTQGEFQLVMDALGVFSTPFYAGNGVVGTTVNTTLGDGIADLVTIKGTVAGSENRLLADAQTNKFAGRVRITEAVNGAGPTFTINNTQVTAISTILITVQSNTAINYTAVVSAIATGVSFSVRIAGPLGMADDLYISYMIINP